MDDQLLSISECARMFPDISYSTWRSAVLAGVVSAEKRGTHYWGVPLCEASEFAARPPSQPTQRRARTTRDAPAPASPKVTIAVAQLLRRHGGHALEINEIQGLAVALGPFVRPPRRFK